MQNHRTITGSTLTLPSSTRKGRRQTRWDRRSFGFCSNVWQHLIEGGKHGASRGRSGEGCHLGGRYGRHLWHHCSGWMISLSLRLQLTLKNDHTHTWVIAGRSETGGRRGDQNLCYLDSRHFQVSFSLESLLKYLLSCKFSGEALNRLNNSSFEAIVVTNTIPQVFLCFFERMIDWF